MFPAMSPRKKKTDSNRVPKKSDAIEWVGGILTCPFVIEKPAPIRPKVMMLLELPSDLIIASEIFNPHEPSIGFTDFLLSATQTPLVGSPRRPDRIRVADKNLAADLRKAIQDIPIKTAQTPELDLLMHHMAQHISQGEMGPGPSYFENGRIPLAIVEDFFNSCEVLYQIKPWTSMADTQVIRLDIPKFKVQGACISIIGNLGESLGVILFPSLKGFESFLHSAENKPDPMAPVSLGTSFMSINFERGGDLPTSMRKEIMEKKLPVADPNAYPMLQRINDEGIVQTLTQRDYKIATACTYSLCSFIIKHRDMFEQDRVDPVSESWLNENNLEVRFTYPYEAGGLYGLKTPTSRQKNF